MRKNILLGMGVMALVSVIHTGCGYTTRSFVSNIKTIYVEPFKNKIEYTTESNRRTYYPLMEVKLTNAVTNRFMFDGNLRVTAKDRADVILKGELLDYRRDPLRYTENNDVQEYRITVTVSLVLWDTAKDQPL